MFIMWFCLLALANVLLLVVVKIFTSNPHKWEEM